jgi:glyoxylase-like metal-dependent hydrolase (beta-lactamase superfamily II)
MASGSFDVQRYATAGGAQIFRLPLQAFPNFTTHTYLALAGNELVLVDAGFPSEMSFASLETNLCQVGRMLGREIRVSDLTCILVTHGHIDHFGGILFLRSRTNAKIGVHELDLQTLTRHEERLAVISCRLRQFLVEAGIPEEERENLLNLYRFTKLVYRSTPVDFTYEAIDMRLDAFEMLHVPGHCPGHVAIRLHDALFVGDHILDVLGTHQSPEMLVPYTGVGHYLDSLTALEDWAGGVRLVLAGHGEPILSLPGCIRGTRQMIAARLSQVHDYLAEPHTIAELTTHLYPDQQGYNGLLVLEKTGAYVEYLYQRNLLEIVNHDQLESGQPVALYYRTIH